MKVIDLLNKIANGEETPKKFRIGYINYDFIRSNAKLDYELFDSLLNEEYKLTDEVEIIEDIPEDKKIEYFDDYRINARCFDELVKSINLYIELNTNKLNEIIDKINGE